ncbi:MAG: ribonucleotide reductase N-terminal alpha domain-containing protein, partial [Alphaproteobacteria bacterium]
MEENKEMDLFDSLDLEPSEAETEERAAESEAQPDVDNDLVGKDDETANVYQTDRVRILIDPARDANLTAFGKETLEDRYLLNDEKGSPQKLFARVACHYADDSAHA